MCVSGVGGVCYAEGFAAAAIKHATRIINGPPAARSCPSPSAAPAPSPSVALRSRLLPPARLGRL